jgi:hypothetical protein
LARPLIVYKDDTALETLRSGSSTKASPTMYVVKRDGRTVPVRFDKITARINKLSYGLNLNFCDPVRLGMGAKAGAAVVHLLRSAVGSPPGHLI